MYSLERQIDHDTPYWEVLTVHPRWQDAQDKLELLDRRRVHHRTMDDRKILAYRIRDIGDQQIENGLRLDAEPKP